jgi:yecA family protein
MQQNPEMPEYDHFAGLVDSLALEVGASELHGVICGLLCAGQSDAHSAWFEELFQECSPDDLLVREARQLLGQLYLATRQKIRDEDLEFRPFLPAGNIVIAKRARALSEWCQGFLYGLALSGVNLADIDEEARESIADITEFTRLDYEAIEPGDESESAYMEIEEFLRVATWVILDALNEQREIEPGNRS